MMLSENGVWVAYDRIDTILADMPDGVARSYFIDLRDMALAAARSGIDVEPCNSDTDRPQRGGNDTTESTEEFDAGTSPCVNTDPRLPRQHTLDAHQLRVLHRAIDTLAFTAEQYRAPDSEPAESSGGEQRQSIIEWLAEDIRGGPDECSDDRRDALEALDWIQRALLTSDAPIEYCEEHIAMIRRALTEPTLPRGVSELIDTTVSAWEPVKDELIEQQARFQRGE